MQAMSERVESYVLQGKVQLDDACLGGELNLARLVGDQRTRSRSSRRIPLMMLNRIHMKVSKLAAFSIAAIGDWALDPLARSCEVISEGLACFRAVAEVGCIH
jgi:hypothetical protein